MNYSKKLLGKELDELTFEDIENFFVDAKEESNKAEFKSYDSRGSLAEKYKGIYKAICGLINSEGGIVIWGAPKGIEVTGKKEKEFKGALTPLDSIIEKDSLINKISDNITPTPNSIRAIVIEKNTTCIVIFEVEKSLYAPHQTSNTYYMRLDGQSRPAPHHYIEALFKQIKYPDLGGYIKFESLRVEGNYYVLYTKIIIVNHSSLLNEENVSFRLTVDNGVIINQEPEKLSLQAHQIYVEDFAKLLHYGGVPYYDLTFCFTPHNLASLNNQAEISLAFSGKKSPMKQSKYKISLANSHPANTNDIVLNYEENQLMYDVGKDKGSEMDKVNIFLGRT